MRDPTICALDKSHAMREPLVVPSEAEAYELLDGSGGESDKKMVNFLEWEDIGNGKSSDVSNRHT